MINALEMMQTVRPVQFSKSKIIHAGVKGQDGHTLCGRSGGWQGGYYGDAVDVTCKRCLPIMERAARKANTDEVIAASDARLAAADVSASPMPSKADEESVMDALINECSRCGVRMNGADAKSHIHFQPVWQLLEMGVSVESAIIDIKAPNGESYLKSQRGLSQWYVREATEDFTFTLDRLMQLIDCNGAWSLYEMPNGDVVAAWSWVGDGEINSVFYITVETEPYTVDAEIMVKIPGLDDVWVSDGTRTYIITPGYTNIGSIPNMYAVREWGHVRNVENVKAVNITYKGLLNAR